MDTTAIVKELQDARAKVQAKLDEMAPQTNPDNERAAVAAIDEALTALAKAQGVLASLEPAPAA